MKQFLQSLKYCKCFELNLLQSSSPVDGWIEGDSIGGEERENSIQLEKIKNGADPSAVLCCVLFQYTRRDQEGQGQTLRLAGKF